MVATTRGGDKRKGPGRVRDCETRCTLGARYFQKPGIKNNTHMQQNTLNKTLKELERRILIKSVKSIHQKPRKIW